LICLPPNGALYKNSLPKSAFSSFSAGSFLFAIENYFLFTGGFPPAPVSMGILEVSIMEELSGAAATSAGATSSTTAGSSAGVSEEPHPIAITDTSARGSAQRKPLILRKVFCIDVNYLIGVKSKVLFLKF
jgi:hypothetical protein